MTIGYTIPSPNTPLNAGGAPNSVWYKFFNGIKNGTTSPETAITIGGSPFSYTATDTGFVVISGGTVSAITIKRSGSAYSLTPANIAIPIGRNDILTITYTVLPTMVIYPT